MDRAARPLCLRDQRAELGPLGDGAGCDRLVDPREVLHHEPASADIGVADLGIAHLAVGQPDIPARGREKGVRALPHHAVEIGGLRGQDGVVAGLGTPAPAVENAQHSGSLTPPRPMPRGWAHKIHRKRNPEL